MIENRHQMLPHANDARLFLRHMLSSKAALDGGVVRRKTGEVNRVVGRPEFLAEMHRRGFSVVENGGQYVVFCNHAPVRKLV